jgi:hypothetical protein
MRIATWATSVLFAAATLVSCGGKSEPASGAPPANQTANAMCPMMAGAMAATTPLVPAEATALQHLRDEERFARDVYAALAVNGGELGQTQGVEEHHFMMMGMLLERYKLSDPSAGRAVGAFADAATQARFAELVERGKAGRSAALAVATEVEDQNLFDLNAALAGTTHDDVRHVYTMLAGMTRGHLRRFYGALTTEGGSYAPKYLDRATFDQVIAAADDAQGMGCMGGDMKGMGAHGMGCMGGDMKGMHGNGMGMQHDMKGMNHGGMGMGMQHGSGAEGGMCPHMGHTQGTP